jgi:UDP-glucose 4-epimerase
VRVLTTGGAGFIGSHLAERMLDRGDEVLLIDNLSTGSMENIRHLKQYERMHYFLEPIGDRQLLAELVDEADVVFHLAAAVGVRLIVESPVRTIETNVNGTQLVFEAACKKRKPVFVASTSEVYGVSAYPSGKMTTLGSGQRARAAGAMRPRKPSTNFWRSPAGKERSSR